MIFANKKEYKRYKITQKETKYFTLFVVFLHIFFSITLKKKDMQKK